MCAKARTTAWTDCTGLICRVAATGGRATDAWQDSEHALPMVLGRVRRAHCFFHLGSGEYFNQIILRKHCLKQTRRASLITRVGIAVPAQGVQSTRLHEFLADSSPALPHGCYVCGRPVWCNNGEKAAIAAAGWCISPSRRRRRGHRRSRRQLGAPCSSRLHSRRRRESAC